MKSLMTITLFQLLFRKSMAPEEDSRLLSWFWLLILQRYDFGLMEKISWVLMCRVYFVKIYLNICLQYKKFGSFKKIEERMMLVANHVDKVSDNFGLSLINGLCMGITIWFLKYYLYFVVHIQLYRPLNIRVRLVGLEIWSNRNMIDVSSIPNLTLERFLQWRQDSLLKRKKHDNAHFVTWVTDCSS